MDLKHLNVLNFLSFDGRSLFIFSLFFLVAFILVHYHVNVLLIIIHLNFFHLLFFIDLFVKSLEHFQILLPSSVLLFPIGLLSLFVLLKLLLEDPLVCGSLGCIGLLRDISHAVHDFSDFLLSGRCLLSSKLLLLVLHFIVFFSQSNLVQFALFFILHALDSVEFIFVNDTLGVLKFGHFLLFLVILLLFYRLL